VNQETLEIKVQCVKARDFEPLKPFHIQGSPYINNTGNFAMLTEPGRGKERDKKQEEVLRLINAITADLQITYPRLTSLTGISRGRVAEIAALGGWEKPQGQRCWSRIGEDGLFKPQEMN
jgi:hypothetical protein